MVGEYIDNNVATVSGKVTTEMEYSHEIYGEGFYQFNLEVARLSNSHDMISITISERLISKDKLLPGMYVVIEGQFRSYNSYSDSSNKLLLTVFAREITILEDSSKIKNPNMVFLNGFICKKPIYRSTPFGREITDLLLAVNRAYNKSDYIPCIAWGRNSRFCSNLKIGDNIKVWGRIQSRAYQKKYGDGSIVDKVAYEMSISKLEYASENNSDNRLLLCSNTDIMDNADINSAINASYTQDTQGVQDARDGQNARDAQDVRSVQGVRSE